jgi:hypothetical protein
MKMGRLLRCSSVTYQFRYAPSNSTEGVSNICLREVIVMKS